MRLVHRWVTLTVMMMELEDPNQIKLVDDLYQSDSLTQLNLIQSPSPTDTNIGVSNAVNITLTIFNN